MSKYEHAKAEITWVPILLTSVVYAGITGALLSMVGEVASIVGAIVVFMALLTMGKITQPKGAK